MGADQIFPEHWKDIIHDKKVVLYNTGVSSLLGEREKHIGKMRQVFQIFKEHPEVILWWRPHPLEISTLQSMLPELEEQYMKVRQQYREEGIGILDESGDLNRAIAVSDAYYGAWSSVLHLYQYTGKPILYARDIVGTTNDRNRLRISDFIIQGNVMWAVSMAYNYLFQMRADNMEVENVFRFPIGFPYARNAITCLIDRKDDLVAVSAFDKHSVVFDQIEKKIHVTDANLPDLSEYSMHYAQTKDYIYLVSKTENVITKVKKTDMSGREILVDGVRTGFEGIIKVDDVFVLIQEETGVIFLWNEETGEIEELGGPPCGFATIDRQWLIGGMVAVGHSAIIFPLCMNMIIEVDTEAKKVKRIGDCFDNENLHDGSLFTCARKIDNRLYIYADYLNEWIIHDLKTKETFKKKNVIPAKIEKQINDNNILEKGGMELSRWKFEEWEAVFPYSIPAYIESLHHTKDGDKEKNLFVKNIGKSIYETV